MAMSAYGECAHLRRALCMQHCSHPPFPSHCSHACTAGIARCRPAHWQAHHHPGTSAGAPHPTARPSNPARPAHSQLQRTHQLLAPAPAVHPHWQDGRSEVFPTLRLRQAQLFSTRSSPPSSSWSTSILSRPRRAPLDLSPSLWFGAAGWSRRGRIGALYRRRWRRGVAGCAGCPPSPLLDCLLGSRRAASEPPGRARVM